MRELVGQIGRDVAGASDGITELSVGLEDRAVG